jgi:hypothetical protein
MIQYVNILQVLYIGMNTPSLIRASNRMDLINEFLIQCIQVNLFIFTSWVSVPEIQYTYGWIMIVELYIFLILNGMIIIYDALSIVVLIFYKYYQRFMKKIMKFINKYFRSEEKKKDDRAPFIFDSYSNDLNIFKLDPIAPHHWARVQAQKRN